MFSFFCSDREYAIGRRIWNCGKSYYCVTKGVSVPSIPRNNKQKRVELFYSSWCIRPVESRKDDGVTSACDVLLFHQEDIGIPREIAKLGVKRGMWGAVKKMEPGLRAYQDQRLSGGRTKLFSACFDGSDQHQDHIRTSRFAQQRCIACHRYSRYTKPRKWSCEF